MDSGINDTMSETDLNEKLEEFYQTLGPSKK
jgi:hypothetical protein